MANPTGGDSSKELAVFGYQAGPLIGKELPVKLPVITIGRGNGSHVLLDDDTVSTQHARLEYEDGYWRITDLDSTNGTYVEGVKLAPQVPTPLSYGATVRFGGVRMQFREVESADPEAARATFTPPPPATPVAQRSTGFRLPLWVLLLILVLIAVAAFLFLNQDLVLGWSPSSAGGAVALHPLPPSPSPAP